MFFVAAYNGFSKKAATSNELILTYLVDMAIFCKENIYCGSVVGNFIYNAK